MKAWLYWYLVKWKTRVETEYLDFPKFKDKNKGKKNAIFYAEIFTHEIAFGLPQISKPYLDC